MVSIHALLAECDLKSSTGEQPGQRFNPRTPCGVRQGNKTMSNQINLFQSTHSLRSATMYLICVSFNEYVSIHALLAECDQIRKRRFNVPWEFQSTHSLRSATLSTGCGGQKRQFQSTHSLRSATNNLAAAVDSGNVSIHALLAECD